MIQLGKKPPTPSLLESPEVEGALDKVRKKVANGEEVVSKDFRGDFWRHDDVRSVLWRYQHKKCCYCERIRDEKREPDIEHFRPKTKIDGVGKPGYWWLAYKWDNLFFSCKRCNQTKLAKFPLMAGQHARDEEDDISAERPVLPHPEHEDPEKLISFHWEFSKIGMAWPLGKDSDGRGSQAIAVLGLDGKDLAEERGELLVSLRAIAEKMHAARHFEKQRLMDRTAKDIEHETASKRRFAGFRRAFFRAHDLGEYVSTK